MKSFSRQHSTFRSFWLALLTAVLMSMSIPAMAGPGGHDRGLDRLERFQLMLDHVSDEVGISAQQRDEIDSIIDQRLSSAVPLLRDLRSNKRELHRAQRVENYDGATIAALANERGELVEALTLLGSEARFAVASVLTAEQREHLAQLKRERAWRRRG